MYPIMDKCCYNILSPVLPRWARGAGTRLALFSKWVIEQATYKGLRTKNFGNLSGIRSRHSQRTNVWS